MRASNCHAALSVHELYHFFKTKTVAHLRPNPTGYSFPMMLSSIAAL